MKLFNAVVAVVDVSLSAATSAKANARYKEVNGATVVAQNGTFQGKMGSAYSSDSIIHEYGTHWSRYSVESIFSRILTIFSRIACVPSPSVFSRKLYLRKSFCNHELRLKLLMLDFIAVIALSFDLRNEVF